VSTIWIRHPETKAVVEVPEPTLPIYRQSGWDLLPEKDLADMQRREADDAAAVEQALRDAAERAGATLPPLPPPPAERAGATLPPLPPPPAETGAAQSPKSTSTKKEIG
jgi:hypothetical protein